MIDEGELVSRKKQLEKQLDHGLPILVLETFQNWGFTQKMAVISCKPRTASEVEELVRAIISYNKGKKEEQKISLRCVGDGHSWSPLFPDQGNVLMYTSQLTLECGERIKLEIEKGAPNPYQVTIAPGVTTGELSKFFTDNNVCLKTDVILDKVTYGGVIAPGCHGVGKDQLAVSDYVLKMSIVGADGTNVNYDLTKVNEEKANALKCNMGLFGVMTDITLKVEPMVVVKVENDFTYTVKDLFYNSQALKNLHDENWSLEIFWFPFNSMKWPCDFMLLFLLKSFYCKHLSNWDPKNDKLWVRKINLVNVAENPAPNEVDYAIQDLQGLLSTGFGRLAAQKLNEEPYLIPSFLKAGFEMVKKFNETTRFEPMNKAIHYQSFIQILPVHDMEFAFNAGPDTFVDQARAIQHVVDITEKYFRRGQFPLSIAMEMRWMAFSKSLICPAHAVQKEGESEIDQQTLYLEVLGLAELSGNSQNWRSYTKEIADQWMAMKPNGKAPLPHWAKQWSYLTDIDNYIKKGYGDNLDKFRNKLSEEERVLFSNARLRKVIFDPLEEEYKANVEEIKSPANAAVMPEPSEAEKAFKKYGIAGIEDILKNHEESWDIFFKTYAEQVWNVPWKVPMMDIQKEWKFTEGLLREVEGKYPDLFVDKTLYKSLF